MCRGGINMNDNEKDVLLTIIKQLGDCVKPINIFCTKCPSQPFCQEEAVNRISMYMLDQHRLVSALEIYLNRKVKDTEIKEAIVEALI